MNIPRLPWLVSEQYGMTFVLSQDNEIILGSDACKKLGSEVITLIVAAVNDGPCYTNEFAELKAALSPEAGS